MKDIKVTVNILGKNYQLKCSLQEKTHLQLAAMQLDKRLQQINEQEAAVGFDKTLLMAALQASFDLVCAKEKLALLEDDTEAQLSSLTTEIDQLLQSQNVLDDKFHQHNPRLFEE